jgi:hypothetical protein
MHMSWRWRVVVFMILGLGGVARSAADPAIDPIWLARAKDEGEKAHEKYQALITHLEEEYESQTAKAPGSSGRIAIREGIQRMSLARLGDNIIYKRVYIPTGASNKPQIRLQCDNNDYHFTLQQSREEASYTLAGYEVGKRRLPLTQYAARFGSPVYGKLRQALDAVKGEDKSTLQILRFDEAKGLLRIEFKNLVVKKFPAVHKMWVDPSHGWRMVEYQSRFDTSVETARMSYGVAVEGVEFPSEIKTVDRFTQANGRPDFETTERLISVKLTDKTPDDFRLSAFGLPEPVDVTPLAKPTRWYLWILVVAGVSAALSFGFAYWRRRRQARLLPTPLPGAGP